jgi:glycosyltransferase involved in cell wall biosynthesis
MRLLAEGDARRGPVGGDLGPADAQALLDAWLGALELQCDGHELLRLLAAGEISHAALHRRARLVHERRLSGAVRAVSAALDSGASLDIHGHAVSLFGACVPAIPYAASAAFLGSEKRKLSGEADQPRVALVADGLDAMHGVSAAVRQIRERGVRGFEVEVIGTDRSVDHRLSAVAEIDAPFYPGLRLGVPGLPAVMGALAEGRYDLVHVCTPGPAGILAGLLAHVMGLALISSYHTELARYAGVRSGRAEVEALVNGGLRTFYRACECVLSPSLASDERLAQLGVGSERIARWDRGVDLTRFDPRLRMPDLLPGTINVLYAGRLASEKGIDLLADAFEMARASDPRLHLVLAGVGPEEAALRRRLGSTATFLGWLAEDELARAYASADVFLFASSTDTFGQVILEAQASGLPVVAVDSGGPSSLIEHGQSGLLCAPRPRQLAEALLALSSWPLLRERLRAGGLANVRERSWESSLDRLAAGYRGALAAATVRRTREIA